MSVVVDEDAALVPAERLAAMAGVTTGTLRYWDQTSVVRPSIARMAGAHEVRLYEFRRAVGVLVAVELRHRGVSLQGLRKLVRPLTDQFAEPFAELAWATEGARVFVQMPDGAWEDGYRPGQGVLISRLDVEALRIRVRASLRRQAEDSGQIDQRRGTLGHKPVFRGTRIPVDTVRRYLARGRSVEQIIRAFPALTEADIRAVA